MGFQQNEQGGRLEEDCDLSQSARPVGYLRALGFVLRTQRRTGEFLSWVVQCDLIYVLQH